MEQLRWMNETQVLWMWERFILLLEHKKPEKGKNDKDRKWVHTEMK